MKNNCIILFAKYPQKGMVKTRLAKDIGEHAAVSIYKNFITDVLAMIRQVNADLRIYYYPPGYEKKFKQWLGSTYTFYPQRGCDLGEKMKNAFASCFNAGYKKTLIIGSDTPDISPALVNRAFTLLNTHDTVIGPSHDGGYYLLGLKNTFFFPEIFRGIPWSTSQVFKKTISILKKKKTDPCILPAHRDVDTAEDLAYLLKKGFIKSSIRSLSDIAYV